MPASPRAPRRVVGVDLGTTHTVVAWADLRDAAAARIFPIPQLVTPTEIEARLVVDSRNALSTTMKGKPNYFKA